MDQPVPLTANDEERGGVATILLIVGLIGCAAAMLALAWQRGDAIDEYWTMWMADPRLPFRQAFWERIIRDTPHPPLFYSINWLVGPLFAEDVLARRLTNAFALILVIPTLLCRRETAPNRYRPLFALVLLSLPYVLANFAEYRSYFLVTIAIACLTIMARELQLRERTDPAGDRRLFGLWFFVVTIIALNLQYMASCAGVALLTVSAAYHWRFGRARTGGLVFAAMVIALIPLITFLAVALSLPRPTLAYQSSLLKGWVIILLMVALGLGGNLALAGRAGWVLTRLRGARDALSNERLAFAAVLAATLALQIIGFALVHTLSGAIIPRQLFGILPIGVALTVELATLDRISLRTLALVTVNALVLALATTIVESRHKRWEAAVPQILAARQACPDVRIIALSHMYLGPRNPALWSLVGHQEATALTYRGVARSHHFPVTLAPGPTRIDVRDDRCGAIIWLEHNYTRPDLTAAEMITLAHVGATRAQTAAATLRRANGSEFVVTIPPAAP